MSVSALGRIRAQVDEESVFFRAIIDKKSPEVFSRMVIDSEIPMNNTPPIADCTAIILAGGESRRMQTDKASLLWQGVPLVEHAIAQMRQVAGQIEIVLRDAQLPINWSADQVLADDESLLPGPLRGIVTGLSACKTEWAFVVPCDAPVLAPELFRYLYDCRQSGDIAVIPEWEGRLQVLHGLYSVAAANQLREHLQAGIQSPTRLLKKLSCRIIPEEQCRPWTPTGESFLNINTPDDLHRLNDQ
jgi:molybdenum cofactor guanylyltransferase